MNGDDPTGLSEQFRLLAHPYRRHAIELLAEHTTLTLADLAELVAERDVDAELTDICPEEVRDVYLELYHVHVPKLVDAHVVRYDQEDDVVSMLDHGHVPLAGGDYVPENRSIAETDPGDGVTVHLSPETAHLIDRAVAVDDDLDASMSFDEVVYHLFRDCYG